MAIHIVRLGQPRSCPLGSLDLGVPFRFVNDALDVYLRLIPYFEIPMAPGNSPQAYDAVCLRTGNVISLDREAMVVPVEATLSYHDSFDSPLEEGA